jgi:hypothetical protein
MSVDDWVPMRWPCGPLDRELRRRGGILTPEDREALEIWTRPRALDLLAATPVSCLVVTWASGLPVDAEQQKVLGPLVQAARRRGLSVVGWVAGDADVPRSASAARSSGLEAIATGSPSSIAELPVLRFRERDDLDRSPSAFLSLTGNVWPGMTETVEEGEGVDAWTGATGRPWIDSNAWAVRLARTLARPRTLWLSFDPPGGGAPVPAPSYVRAVADTALYGARWVVALDPHLRLGLAGGRAAALDTWAQIGRGMAFFRKHRAWGDYRPVGQLGVVSDYTGASASFSHEVLILLARQGSLFRILPKDEAGTADFDGLDAILYVDPDPPGPDLRHRLYDFAEEGGTVITPPGWEERGAPLDTAWFHRFRVSRYGAGRLAVAREELVDPNALAEDAQLLMSHSRDRIRVFNPGVAVHHYSTSTDGRAAVMQMLRFTSRSAYEGRVTVWFRKPWESGRTWTVGTEGPKATDRTSATPGVEFHLPPVSVYCALDVST